MTSTEHTWKIIEGYFEKKGFSYHQIASFDNFIMRSLPELISQSPDIYIPGEEKNVTISFSNVFVSEPTVIEENRELRGPLPMECRRRNLTYDSPIYVDVRCTVEHLESGETNTQTYQRVVLARIPIMLRSARCRLSKLTAEERIEAGECPYDHGGYFIVKGNERVIISQVRDAYNIPLVYSHVGKKWKLSAEMRSMSEETGHSVMVKALLGSNNRTLHFELPYLKDTVPMGLIFRAYGCTSQDDISSIVGLSCEPAQKFIKLISRDAMLVETDEELFSLVGKKAIHTIKEGDRSAYVNQIIDGEIFPHMGVTSSRFEKLLMLGTIVNRLIATEIGMRDPDDRDDYMNKRVESAGILCHDLFRQLYKKFTDCIVAQIEKKRHDPDILSLVSKTKIITAGFKQCFTVGNWGVPKSSYMKVGVAQILSRMSFGATLSHLKRINLTVGKEVNNAKIRQLHPSTIMFICPSETPEGQTVGIVLNLCLMTQISERASTVLLKKYLESFGKIERIDEYEGSLEATKVFVNGAPFGFTEDPNGLVKELRQIRQSGCLPYDVSFSYNVSDDSVYVLGDEGRLLRPILALKKSVDSETMVLSLEPGDGCDWDSLVEQGKIQYIDNSEANSSIIAFSENELSQYANDFCEISPSMILGTMASIIPFPEHSPSPRVCYIAAMGKQAMGVHSLSHLLRTDTTVHVLRCQQRALVGTRQSALMGFNDMPTGINVVVAVMCHGGKNQEDSILIKKEAVERGMFVADTYKTHEEEEKKEGSYVSFKIGNPPIDKRRRESNYSLLGEDGVVRLRDDTGNSIWVSEGDVIIGKTIVTTSKDGKTTVSDASLAIKKGEEGFVDRIVKSVTPNGYILVKVVVRKPRIPEVGDKFVSREAQKGTCGDIVPSVDMPFTAEGIIPDIFLNPHAFPSRMTVNQLMEGVLGKVCALTGEFGDATVFGETSSNIERICDVLQSQGYKRDGNEVMYSGTTGEPLDVEIFVGPTYYQRLKHLVSDKYHSRARGQMNTLFRQPMSGRAKGGGLRLGEMESCALSAHGTSRFMHERLCEHSDPFEITVCESCGGFTSGPVECKSCGSENAVTVQTSYASKLIVQELNALCIKTAMTTE